MQICSDVLFSKLRTHSAPHLRATASTLKPKILRGTEPQRKHKISLAN